MTDGWHLVCKCCGEELINHTIYIDEVPANAIEGYFAGPMRGFYCLTRDDTDEPA